MTAFSKPSAIANYAEKTAKIVPGLHDLHRMTAVLLAESAPDQARILVLGAGGGLELKSCAEIQPTWHFYGVDPSAAMLDLARSTLGPLSSRVYLHEGYLESTPVQLFDGATCLFTLHFLPPAQRLQTLKQLFIRLKPGAPLVVAHHSFALNAASADRWLARNAAFATVCGVPASQSTHSIDAIKEHLPVLTPQQDVELLHQAGFADIEQFYCAFTFKGWVAHKPETPSSS